jgi:hypothetical protein
VISHNCSGYPRQAGSRTSGSSGWNEKGGVLCDNSSRRETQILRKGERRKDDSSRESRRGSGGKRDSERQAGELPRQREELTSFRPGEEDPICRPVGAFFFLVARHFGTLSPIQAEAI